MAGTTTTALLRAPRAAVYRAIADVRTLADCLRPAGTSARILEHDPARAVVRMEITHAPGPGGTRRFRLERAGVQPDERVDYAAAFEGDSALAGEMRLRFELADAPGGTLVTVRHEGLPDAIRPEDNERGTASSLSNLARLVEAGEA